MHGEGGLFRLAHHRRHEQPVPRAAARQEQLRLRLAIRLNLRVDRRIIRRNDDKMNAGKARGIVGRGDERQPRRLNAADIVADARRKHGDAAAALGERLRLHARRPPAADNQRPNFLGKQRQKQKRK